ncbi:hypothetical protein EST38_g1372 [Candolleomyces aberdarensis]|uniref:Cleavage/polyadenylation specificity factor A subunit N-terminal domain-containing protein n=1 Tax=Candolleomyces aberdarensis TaxID=2316362 RepID=A0A4Q2DVK9_9AGAR|nr:hypothetical protein EST38_g1372 [Candolleomyces aberdarensis]
MIAHPDPEIIFFTYAERTDGRMELSVNYSLVLHERPTTGTAEFFNDLLIHPSGKLAVAHCYSTRIKIIELKAGNYVGDYDSVLPERNVLSMAFLPTEEEEYALAILHLDPMQRIQLLGRDIVTNDESEDWELSPFPSTILQPTAISNKTIPFPTEYPPHLIPVQPADLPEDEDEDEDEKEDDSSDFLGGVLVVGGRKLLLYELATPEGRAKQKGKMKRLQDKLKGNSDPIKLKEARAKQLERDARKRKPTASVDWPWGEMTAWCDVEGAPLRFFLADAFGTLSLLSLDSVKNSGLLLIPLGVTSPATSLTYLTNQVLYVGSHLGDSQLITISQIPSKNEDQVVPEIPFGIQTHDRTTIASGTKKGKQRADDDMDVDSSEQDGDELANGRIIAPDGSYVRVVQSFKNIGPIVDAVMVDVEGSGQQQLVTCSGGNNTGSLNVIRNGSEYQGLASIPGIMNLTGIWATKPNFEASEHTHIIASTNSQTLFYRFNDAGADTSLVQLSDTGKGLKTNERTLAFGNIQRRGTVAGKASYFDSNQVVQVVKSGVYLLEYDRALEGYIEKARYLPQDLRLTGNITEIVAASINASQIAVAFNGGLVVLLNVNETSNGFNRLAFKHDHYREVSAISCLPATSTSPFSPFVAVSYWRTNHAEILQFSQEKLVTVVKTDALPAIVRSLQLFNFNVQKGLPDYQIYLICGLGNGSLAHFKFDPKAKQLLDKKIVSLGHAPVSLTVCEVNTKASIFAAGNRATVVSLDNKKLVHSPVMLKDMVGACRFNSKSFPNSLVLAGAEGLTIGRVLDLNKLNVRTIPLGYDNPRRIAYIPLLRCFAVACTIAKGIRIGEFEPVKSVLRLYDDTNFTVLSEFKCDVNEEITSLAGFTHKVEGKEFSYICAGSVIYPDEDNKPVQGRLRIFTAVAQDGPATSNTDLTLVTSEDIVGCVYAVKSVNDKLVVAAESAVILFNFVRDATSPATFTLESAATWYNNYIVSSLGSYGDHIVTGDQISTVSLIKVSENKFESEARDFGPLCPVAVEALNERHIITANVSLKLDPATPE